MSMKTSGGQETFQTQLRSINLKMQQTEKNLKATLQLLRMTQDYIPHDAQLRQWIRELLAEAEKEGL